MAAQSTEAEEALLFVNKKKQKNFVTLRQGRWRHRAPCPAYQKFFAPGAPRRFFSKKRLLASLLQPLTKLSDAGAGLAQKFV
jgi:hypothetical protein